MTRHAEPERVKCLKCQARILKKDAPKRCPRGTPGFESHAYELGRESGEWPWITPYGMSDATWKEQQD